MSARSTTKTSSPGTVEPGDLLAQVETVGLEGGAGVTGQEPGDRPVDPLAGRVDVDQDELAEVSLRWVVVYMRVSSC